jgi:hypothetical protein
VSVPRDSSRSFEAVPLRALGLSQDGDQLVLAGDDGQRFCVPVDDRLRTIVRGTAGRLGQQEVRLESALSPKDMQARLRAGASAEDVAKAAGIPLERVTTYEVPVIAERNRVVTEARAARLSHWADEPRRPLGELVDDRLAIAGIPPHDCVWNSWRRPDGTWMVHVTYQADGEDRRANWTWDPAGRRIRPFDAEAEALIAPPAKPALPVRAPEPVVVLPPSIPELSLVAPADEPAAEADASGPPVVEPAAAEAGQTAPTGQRSSSRRGRAAVPSWDDIVFGTRR